MFLAPDFTPNLERTCRRPGISPFAGVRTSRGRMRFSSALTIDYVSRLTLISTLSIEFLVFQYRFDQL